MFTDTQCFKQLALICLAISWRIFTEFHIFWGDRTW